MVKENFFDRYVGIVSIERVCENVIWLIRLRWIACLGLLFGILFGKAFFEVNIQSLIPIFVIGICIFISNIIFYFRYSYLRRESKRQNKACIEKRLIFMNIQIFIDLIMLSAIVYFTGGISTPLPFFFIFHMVISSITLSRLNAYFWAVFTIIIQSVMTYLEHINLIGHINFFAFINGINEKSTYSEFFILIVFSITLLITVYFATTIMRPIRRKQLDLTILKNDLLEEKRKLELKNLELEKLDKSKTEFLYRVEHEMKAPISAVLSMLSVVIRAYDSVDEEKKNDFINRSIKRIKTMKDMVAELLSLSRIESKDYELNLEKLDFLGLTEEIITDLQPFAQKKGIKIETVFDENIQIFEGDRTAVSEIIKNIIHNAIKYSIEGNIYVRLKSDNNNIIFEVQDNGIGIAEDDLKNIFNEFFRAENAKVFENGTGLGLSLVKKLVEQHGGNIRLKSEINEGTICTIELPLS